MKWMYILNLGRYAYCKNCAYPEIVRYQSTYAFFEEGDHTNCPTIFITGGMILLGYLYIPYTHSARKFPKIIVFPGFYYRMYYFPMVFIPFIGGDRHPGLLVPGVS